MALLPLILRVISDLESRHVNPESTQRPRRSRRPPRPGGHRRYHPPLLTAATRLLLPAGIKAVSIQDFYSRPHLASVESAWPRMTATDGTTVDASIIPERGA